MTPKPVVLDTNALVSRLLVSDSVPARVVRLATREARILVSDATLMELADVLARPKFDPYVTIRERQNFLRLFAQIAERVEIVRRVHASRDPKDDKFLELALNGSADVLVTGDRDLLGLDPFHNTRILSPGDYLRLVTHGV
jgi:putative PIN family toxin of toxin-antitoxin system